MIFAVSLPGIELIRAQNPGLCRRGNEKRIIIITDVSYAASQTPILKPIHPMVVVLRSNLPVLRTMASSDCPFQQDPACSAPLWYPRS
jgi:hypothetical protein